MNTPTRKQLERNARKLAQRFFDQAQGLFDDDGMTIEIAEGPVFEALQMAQGFAEDVINAE